MEVVEVKNGYGGGGGGGGGTTVCVTGASGFIGSWLVMRLLQRGHYVRATVRDPDNTDKVKHLLDLPNATTHLSLWKADLDEDGSFDDAIQGCDGVFHVATPMNFVFVKDPENEYIKPTVDGVLNVMRSCCKAKTVKRIIYTSTMGTVEYQQKPPSQYDESIWTDVDFCRARKMFAWLQFGGPRRRLLLPTLTAGLLTSKLLLPKRMTTPAILSDRMYLVAKTEAEKAAWKFAEENGLDLITVHPCTVIGPFITPYKPPCTSMALALVTKNKAFYPMLTQGHAVHVDDVCNAHIYLFEHPQAKGRYICSSHSFTIFDLANSLSKKYPEHNIQTKFEDIDESLKPIPCPSKKLLDLGFKFKYNSDECDAGDLCAEAIEACKEKGQMPSL